MKKQKEAAALEHVSRALDLLRAFGMKPDDPRYSENILKIKGLLETTKQELSR